MSVAGCDNFNPAIVWLLFNTRPATMQQRSGCFVRLVEPGSGFPMRFLVFCFFGLWGEREHATPAGFGSRDVELSQLRD